MHAVIDGGEATWASVMRATAADPSIPLLAAVFVMAVILLRSGRFGEPRNLAEACEGSEVSITDGSDAGADPPCPISSGGACSLARDDGEGSRHLLFGGPSDGS